MNDITRTKFNVSILGEGKVGKTSICSVFLGNEFKELTLQTVGLENVLVPVKFDGKTYKFKIFDTAGQERYRSIAKNTINLADGFLLVFGVDDINSFRPLGEWIKSIEEKCDISKKVLILVGNKIDKEKREVTKEEALSFAKSKNIRYFEIYMLIVIEQKYIKKQEKKEAETLGKKYRCKKGFEDFIKGWWNTNEVICKQKYFKNSDKNIFILKS